MLRQQCGEIYLKCLSEGKHIINIDESLISSLQYPGRSWYYKGRTQYIQEEKIPYRVSLVAAVSSHGKVYASILAGNSSALTTMVFLLQLVRILQAEDPLWREKVVIVMDNASYHHHYKVKQLISVLEIPVLYLSQQSPNIAPIEYCFARVKKGDRNKLRISMAKRCGC